MDKVDVTVSTDFYGVPDFRLKELLAAEKERDQLRRRVQELGAQTARGSMTAEMSVLQEENNRLRQRVQELEAQAVYIAIYQLGGNIVQVSIAETMRDAVVDMLHRVGLGNAKVPFEDKEIKTMLKELCGDGEGFWVGSAVPAAAPVGQVKEVACDVC